MRLSHDAVVDATRDWVDRAVIGLNLCPFARAVQAKRQVRYVVSDAVDEASLVTDLVGELVRLRDTNPADLETTLLIHPQVLADFLDYNAFLDKADDSVARLGLEGVIQVASFHPDYQFEGSAPDDIDNFSNRSPYPTLHLLRESSVEKAVAAFPNAADIYLRNIETLRRLGHRGLAAWMASPTS